MQDPELIDGMFRHHWGKLTMILSIIDKEKPTEESLKERVERLEREL